MNLKKAIKRNLRIVYSPEKEFEASQHRTLEETAEDYIFLLLAASFLAGLTRLLYQLGYAAYINLFKGISIDYLRLLNYSAGNSVSLFFFYIFAGTFLLFIASIIIKPFLKGIKYSKLVALLLYSAAPLLLFSWIAPAAMLPLLIWSIFLLVCGVKSFRKAEEQKRAEEKARKALKKAKRR